MTRQKPTLLSDIHVSEFEPLDPPKQIKLELPLPNEAADTVVSARGTLRDMLAGKDSRLAVVVGPCSIHDTKGALEYAGRLNELQKVVAKHFFLIMRVYFEKPRTTIGWKGLINDPLLDGSANINLGLRKARELLVAINRLGIPCATEFLDPIVPQYTADLVSWTAIGARTTESQTHREMASGLSMPVGFKNSTDGDLQVALDAMISARNPHSFFGIDQNGHTAVVRTRGNPNVHLVLRGGNGRPNYTAPHIAFAKVAIGAPKKQRPILVDCSHGNSMKDYRLQPVAFENVLKQVIEGENSILGMMLESYLKEGNQAVKSPRQLQYGVSITDPCLGWNATEKLIKDAFRLL